MTEKQARKTAHKQKSGEPLGQIVSIESTNQTSLILNPKPSPCCPPQQGQNSTAQKAGCCPPSRADSCATVDGNTESGEPCCGPRVMPKLSYIRVSHETFNGFPRVDAALSLADRFGAVRARLGNFRMNYAIQPGLYALGDPNPNSVVLVTANYKLSFDHLRAHLQSRDVWILVLDTWGINVWCAAGKGTFGTSELVRRIQQTNLAQVVTTRKLILPQLGAPGVAAHQVKRQTGFSCVWGPVEAKDLGMFLDNGHKATPAMRKKHFSVVERTVLLPIELRPALKQVIVGVLIASPLAALASSGNYLYSVVHYLILLSIFMLSAVVSGAILTPLLLPFLPGRAFSAKSILPSLVISALLYQALHHQIVPLELTALSLLLLGVASYAALNFTGASTYTSISGVKKEMRIAVPAQIVAGLSGIILWIASQLIV